jgi:CheY-like chemotaxis protein/predicted phosphodiesterase
MIDPTILVADNSLEYCKSLESLLTAYGFRVIVASSVEEAKTKINTDPLDLIIADLRLTNDNDDYDFSGLEVTRKASEIGIPCIIVTAFPSIEVTREALRTRGVEPPHASDLIPKSFGPGTILQSVNDALFIDHFSLLHISDLHFRTTRNNQPYDQERSLRAILEDIKGLRREQKIARIKTIIISGDIGYKGREDSYNAAWLFLQNLCSELLISPKDVVLVPGNHDINRNKACAESLQIPSSARGNSILFSKFEAFLNFSSHFYDTPAFSTDKLYRIFDFGKVVIVAFNSCCREGNPLYKRRVRGNDYYQGWINEDQASQAINEMEAIVSGRNVLRLAVCHHHVLPEDNNEVRSGSYLVNYNEYLKFRLAEAKIRILLHGHGHRTQPYQPYIPGTMIPYTFGSGTLLIEKEASGPKQSQYLILDFSPHSRLIMRKYVFSEGDRLGGWIADDNFLVGGILDLPGLALPK